jgi:hypothetical protein
MVYDVRNVAIPYLRINLTTSVSTVTIPLRVIRYILQSLFRVT